MSERLIVSHYENNLRRRGEAPEPDRGAAGRARLRHRARVPGQRAQARTKGLGAAVVSRPSRLLSSPGLLSAGLERPAAADPGSRWSWSRRSLSARSAAASTTSRSTLPANDCSSPSSATTAWASWTWLRASSCAGSAASMSQGVAHDPATDTVFVGRRRRLVGQLKGRRARSALSSLAPMPTTSVSTLRPGSGGRLRRRRARPGGRAGQPTAEVLCPAIPNLSSSSAAGRGSS